MMMAAHEVLNTLALAHPDPEELFRLANERLYSLRGDPSRRPPRREFRRSRLSRLPASSGIVRYSLAGQPPPIAATKLLTGRDPLHAEPPASPRRPQDRRPSGARGRTRTGRPASRLLGRSGRGAVARRRALWRGTTRRGACATHRRTSPQAAVNHILEEIEAFTCGHTPYDDVTLLAAGRTGV